MIFLDNGPLVGRAVPGDEHHADSMRGWDLLAEAPRLRVVTTPLVLNEFLTYLTRAAERKHRQEVHATAAATVEDILASSTIDVVRPTTDHDRAALQLFREQAAEAITFTDCLSFVIMRQRGIEHYFGFDHRHFEPQGFTRWPEH